MAVAKKKANMKTIVMIIAGIVLLLVVMAGLQSMIKRGLMG